MIIIEKDNILRKIKVFFSLVKKYSNAKGINKKRKYVDEESKDLLKSAAQNDDKII
jgi:hypothetical protein